MISSVTTVVVERVQRQLVRLTQGDRETVIEVNPRPRFAVISGGLQGPVGTVAEHVLEQAANAERAAKQADTVATATALDLDVLVSDMKNAFNYHAGAISAMGR
ncbi:hypothetical protein H4G63_004526 [Salmonella enterica]|uniref:hypothetical protein n=1 Tax=Aeromonas TaxID=642 RepID=UPI00199B0578|nr:hypothetical protein [Aeromonas jandaei]EFY7055483.1 hypothetical protein [Salmonella enterica]EGE9999206.1 hypothetical protein [Salmonella enterica]EHU3740649.1 hypothetical protein [Salmonella enterica]EHW9253339.1 hypothetical protein [Salmonella enterica]EHX4880617.1 hypothetical protein [Salmonella enterica]